MQHPIVSCAQILHKGHDFNNNEIPKKIQSFSESIHYPVYDAWLHFYEEEKKCKIYTDGLVPYLDHIKKFSGAASLDRSNGWCDNIEDQKNMNQVNEYSRKVFAKNGIPYVTNVRFGDAKSYSFCFQNIPQKSVLFVGSHGTQSYADYKVVFLAGVEAMIKWLYPRALLFYGVVDERILDVCIAKDILLVRYPSQCSVIYEQQELLKSAC